jgi:hypothetical protein
MKDSSSIHKSVQEMCDCFATTDPLKEMSKIKSNSGDDDSAVKWMALTTLHGVNQNAKKISILRDENGRVKVLAEYRTTELPTPDGDTADRIFDAVREMTHIETDNGKTAMALGIRDSSLDLNIEIDKKKDHEKITIYFPDEAS